MLIEFRVSNFRSIRDEQVLSFVAAKDPTLQETHTQSTGIKAVPALLQSAAIYGPNAGGKSNLIKALQYMRAVVMESAAVVKPGQTYNVQAFQLDAEFVTKPTEFEITLIIDGARYQYGFAMTPSRIVSEHLLVYKAFKPQSWFRRYHDEDSDQDVYEFGAGLKGQKAVWQEATRPNSLFLSMAAQLNSESLRPVFNWFAEHLVIFNEVTALNPGVTIAQLQQTEGKQAICDFLSAADISLADIEVISKKLPGQSLRFDMAAGKTEVHPHEMEHNELKFHHVTARGEAVFDLSDESSGTRNLLFMAGPVLDIVRKGLTLVIDELDTSLHTMLVRHLVRLFHDPTINQHGAQLIFTTHDTSLLDATGLFRRDQIWFVEKDNDQASHLYPLSDFSPRKNEALERGYLMGRYGGLPLVTTKGVKR